MHQSALLTICEILRVPIIHIGQIDALPYVPQHSARQVVGSQQTFLGSRQSPDIFNS